MGRGTARGGHLACTEEISRVRFPDGPQSVRVMGTSGQLINKDPDIERIRMKNILEIVFINVLKVNSPLFISLVDNVHSKLWPKYNAH